ncbi:hypothetical protein [Fulvivirga ligni]|uniref:hypothetical protein n=1 Tax=Fulvivirga ligni TaxID=2904246 RepID=UPI001F2B31FC|nr:hypothetical protein [Fulvivirga ligni]UII24212.1 hypothetical protein LVD16_13400 [Fulvivirga ligni]
MAEDRKHKEFKLDALKKENVYKVPDHYFEQLPHKIQEQAVESSKKRGWVFTPSAVRLALPSLVILLVAVYIIWLKPSTEIEGPNAQELLAQVSSEEIINYLEDTDITTEEILENIDLSTTEFDFEHDDTILLDDFDLDENQLNDLIDEYSGIQEI